MGHVFPGLGKSCSELFNAPMGQGGEEAGARCSIGVLASNGDVQRLLGFVGVGIVPVMRRDFEWACGMLAFLYGDGIVELRRGVRSFRVMARVSTTRASTLFAAAARYLVFASEGSGGSVYCGHGLTRSDMRFVVPLDIEALRYLGLGHLMEGKKGVRRDLFTCMDDDKAVMHVAAGLIDSEGSISKKAWRIYIGMKDAGLLTQLGRRLSELGIEVVPARFLRNGVMILEFKGSERIRGIVESVVNPSKRVLMARMLIDKRTLRKKIYRVLVNEVRIVARRLDEPVGAAECLGCAKTVLREARALASTGDMEGGCSIPPSTFVAMFVLFLLVLVCPSLS